MPTVRRFGSIALKIYADDHHPPHFHLVSAEYQLLVRIADLEVLAGSAKPGWASEAFRWAGEHRAELLAMWERLNERG